MTETRKKGPRIPKKITQSYLENAALFYLQRYASSAANLRRILLHKIKKSCQHHKTSVEDFIPLLDGIIARYNSSGLLNDAQFSKSKAESLRRQGRSAWYIRQKLSIKGLSEEDINRSLDEVGNDEEAEISAALILIKKKKLGGLRPGNSASKEQNMKDIAVLARAGFSYKVATAALEITCKDK